MMRFRRIFFTGIFLGMAWVLATGGSNAAGQPAVAAGLSDSQAVSQCEFLLEAGSALQEDSFPLLSAPEVVLSANSALAVAGWHPGGEKLLVVRDLAGSRQAVEWWETASRSTETILERNLTNSRPVWWPGDGREGGEVISADWKYAGGAPGQAVYLLRSAEGVLAEGLTGMDVDVLGTGELGYFSGEHRWLTRGENGEMRGAFVPLPGRQSSEYLETDLPWQAPAYQVAPRPGTAEILYYTQPGTFWVRPGSTCALELGFSGAGEDHPAWALDAQWSPDGRYLALITTTSHPADARGTGAQIQSTVLELLDFNTQTRRIVSLAPRLSTGQSYVTDLAWSPDSQVLAALAILELREDGSEGEGLFLVAPGTGASTYAGGAGELGGGAWGMQLAWSPGGETLAAACPTETQGRICLLQVLGKSTAVQAPPALPPVEPSLPAPPRAGDYTMPDEIELEVYRLTASGARRSPYTLCQVPELPGFAGDTAWGCTVFCSENGYGCTKDYLPGAIFPYPYHDNPVTLLFEEEYLFNVVPQETPPYYDRLAVDAQTVAARSYAAYHILNPPAIPYNNSTGFQAFIPRRFEGLYYARYPNDSDYLWDDPCGADYNSLNSSQKKVCDAFTKSGLYGVFMSYQGTTPIRSEFSADAYAVTKSGSPPYHVSVPDPISTACDANDFGHQRGMSQEGASRWGRGHECAYATATVRPENRPGRDWPIKFTATQILFHYYTGVHLRSQEGDLLTPNSRWLVLNYGWRYPFNNMLPTGKYPIELQIQNAGTTTWEDGPGEEGAGGLMVVWKEDVNEIVRQVYPLGIVMAPGSTKWIAFFLQPPLLSPGNYTLTFEMAQFTGEAWRSFSELDGGFPPYTPFTLTQNISFDLAPYRLFFPLVNQ